MLLTCPHLEHKAAFFPGFLFGYDIGVISVSFPDQFAQAIP